MAANRILIIDDDPDITEAMKVVLENKGYQVASAAGGADGLERMKQEKPDLVILDVMMSTSSEGFVISREIKSDPNLKKIPILMVTAAKERTGIDFQAASGDETWLPVEAYLDKPVKPDVLVQKVEELLKT